MLFTKPKSNEKKQLQVKICGITDAVEMLMLDRIGADFAGIWFNVPKGKHNLTKTQFVQLARTPVNRLQCVGVTTESDPEMVCQWVREAGIKNIQLQGFLLPNDVMSLKRRLGEDVSVFKVLHIQNGKCLEKPMLKEYALCGADAFILDNFISRELNGSTGQRISEETVESLVDVFGMERVFLAGGLDEQGVRGLRSKLPLRGVDIDTGARIHSRIDGQRVMSIVSAARE